MEHICAAIPLCLTSALRPGCRNASCQAYALLGACWALTRKAAQPGLGRAGREWGRGLLRKGEGTHNLKSQSGWPGRGRAGIGPWVFYDTQRIPLQGSLELGLQFIHSRYQTPAKQYTTTSSGNTKLPHPSPALSPPAPPGLVVAGGRFGNGVQAGLPVAVAQAARVHWQLEAARAVGAPRVSPQKA